MLLPVSVGFAPAPDTVNAPAPDILAGDVDVSLAVAKFSVAPLLIVTAPWIEEAIPDRVPLVIFVLDTVLVPVKPKLPVLTKVPAPDIPPEKLPPPTVRLLLLEIAIDPAPLIEPTLVLSVALRVPATA